MLTKRREAFDKRIALNHWPHEFNKAGMDIMAKNIKLGNVKFDAVEKTP